MRMVNLCGCIEAWRTHFPMRFLTHSRDYGVQKPFSAGTLPKVGASRNATSSDNIALQLLAAAMNTKWL
jgi:hypothetical protein